MLRPARVVRLERAASPVGARWRRWAGAPALAALAKEVGDLRALGHGVGPADAAGERPAVAVEGHADLLHRVAPHVRHLDGKLALFQEAAGRLPHPHQAAP